MNNANNIFLANESAGDPTRDRGALQTLLLATAVTVLLWFVPYASAVTYPLRLLGTFIHEGGHALAALATGGTVREIEVYADGSGVTYALGGSAFATIWAGYLGATLYGALLIALVRRGTSGRTLLVATGALIGVLTLLFTRNLFGFGWGAVLAAALVLLGLRLAPRAADWAAAFLGVQCALNALFDLRTLLFLSSRQPAATTDAVLMSGILPLPPVVWAVVWTALSLALLWLAARPRARRRRAAA